MPLNWRPPKIIPLILRLMWCVNNSSLARTKQLQLQPDRIIILQSLMFALYKRRICYCWWVCAAFPDEALFCVSGYVDKHFFYFFLYFSRMQTLFYMSILGLKFNQVHTYTHLQDTHLQCKKITLLFIYSLIYKG
jgi:hypothetical protein